MKAAVFDSGVGGLTVVGSLVNHRLFEEIVYFGDTARVPYGTKDPNTIIRYSLEALEFFQNFDVEMMIVACNTASAHALPDLRKIARMPVAGVIEPGVLSAVRNAPDKDARILVIGTRATVRSGEYVRLLNQEGYRNVTAVATGLLVSLVEEGIEEGPVLQATLDYYFKEIPKPDVVILGCTHFPLLSKAIGEYFAGAKLIHSGEAIVEYLEREKMVKNGQRFEKTKLKLFASENGHRLKEVAQHWIGKEAPWYL